MLALVLAATVGLVDQRGAHFTFDDLRGAPTAVAFVAAHCTDVCPLVDAQLAEAASHARRLGLPLHLVTIALDGAQLSGAELRALSARYGANPHTWRFARGSQTAISTFARAFGVTTERLRDGSIAHTSFVYLLAADGKLFATLPASSSLGEDLVTEVRTAWLPLSR